MSSPPYDARQVNALTQFLEQKQLWLQAAEFFAAHEFVNEISVVRSLESEGEGDDFTLVLGLRVDVTEVSGDWQALSESFHEAEYILNDLKEGEANTPSSQRQEDLLDIRKYFSLFFYESVWASAPYLTSPEIVTLNRKQVLQWRQDWGNEVRQRIADFVALESGTDLVPDKPPEPPEFLDPVEPNLAGEELEPGLVAVEIDGVQLTTRIDARGRQHFLAEAPLAAARTAGLITTSEVVAAYLDRKLSKPSCLQLLAGMGIPVSEFMRIRGLSDWEVKNPYDEER